MRSRMALAAMLVLVLAVGAAGFGIGAVRGHGAATGVEVTAIARTSPRTAQVSPTDALGWMAGCWAAGDGGSSRMEELWTRPGAGVMLGVSRTVRDGVLAGFEHLLLTARGDTAIYRASPSGQTTTEFASTHVSDTLAVFENPEHDFPRAISYRRAPGDSLHAHVAGLGADGSLSGFVIRYGRSPCP